MRTALHVLLVVFVLGIPTGCVFAEVHFGIPEVVVPEMLLSEETLSLYELADEPWRPLWGPLPIFRTEANATALLHTLLESSDAQDRARSAFLLGQIGHPRSADLLADRLDDPDRDVRIHSGIALAWIGDSRGVPVCTAVMVHSPSWVKYYAVYGLWNIDTPEARDILQKYANIRDPLVNRAVTGALKTSRIPPPRHEPLSREGVSERTSADEVWDEACNIFVAEADWWWHGGDYEQSIRCLEVALFLDPLYIDGYSSIAWLQWSMRRDRDAVGTLRRAVTAAPTDPEAHFELGYHYFNTNRYAQAEGPLSKAVELGGDHRARRTYAHCLERLGKLEESLAQWKAIIDADPNDAAARLNHDRVAVLIEDNNQ